MTMITDINQTPIIHAPNFSPSLAQVAMLVSVEIRLPSFSKKDKKVTKQVTAANNASDSAGSYVKSLMEGCAEYKDCVNYRATVHNWLQVEAFDWAASLRCLPVARLPRFLEQFAEHETEFYRRCNKFFGVYEEAIAKQAFVHGATFKRDDYPSLDDLKTSGRFSIKLYQQEIPTGDFRNMVGINAVQDAVVNLQQQANDFVRDMVSRQIEDFAEVITSIAKNCRVETVIGENGEIKTKRGRLFETTFTKALDYCDLLDSFNVTADPRLETLRDEVRRVLNGVTVDKLRDSDTARITVQEEFNDIKSRFGF